MRTQKRFYSIFPLLLLSAAIFAQTTAPATAPAPIPFVVPSRVHLEAEFSRLDGKNLVVRFYDAVPADNKGPRPLEDHESLIETNPLTSYLINLEKAKPEDLKPGMKLTLFTFERTTPILNISAMDPNRYGTFLGVDGKNLQITSDGKPITIATDENTKIILRDQLIAGNVIPGGPHKLEDLDSSMSFFIFPDTGTATKIIAIRPAIVTPPPPPPRRLTAPPPAPPAENP